MKKLEITNDNDKLELECNNLSCMYCSNIDLENNIELEKNVCSINDYECRAKLDTEEFYK
ncbi:MAG: hypothetical protein J6B63_04710 [Treponema sp.]|nr:hypothetical protein [Treponema sp.]MBP3630257.1 hypothetical protein [Clostridia bacterium]